MLAKRYMAGSFARSLEDPRTVARFALPWEDENCQIWEIGMQGYAGKYVVTAGDFRRNGTTITAAQVTAANPTTVRGGAGGPPGLAADGLSDAPSGIVAHATDRCAAR